MNQKALKVLEYDKIIQLLAEQATSDAGKKTMSGTGSDDR